MDMAGGCRYMGWVMLDAGYDWCHQLDDSGWRLTIELVGHHSVTRNGKDEMPFGRFGGSFFHNIIGNLEFGFIVQAGADMNALGSQESVSHGTTDGNNISDLNETLHNIK